MMMASDGGTGTASLLLSDKKALVSLFYDVMKTLKILDREKITRENCLIVIIFENMLCSCFNVLNKKRMVLVVNRELNFEVYCLIFQ